LNARSAVGTAAFAGDALAVTRITAAAAAMTGNIHRGRFGFSGCRITRPRSDVTRARVTASVRFRVGQSGRSYAPRARTWRSGITGAWSTLFPRRVPGDAIRGDNRDVDPVVRPAGYDGAGQPRTPAAGRESIDSNRADDVKELLGRHGITCVMHSDLVATAAAVDLLEALGVWPVTAPRG